MGKRTLVFKRFTDSFKYLWKEAISDIIRDFHIYLMDHPDIDGIVERSIGDTDTGSNPPASAKIVYAGDPNRKS